MGRRPPRPVVRARRRSAVVAPACLTPRAFSPVSGSARAALLVGGVGGGFDSPARDLYGKLAEELPGLGISCLRVRYRDPGDLRSSIQDVEAGVSFLVAEGSRRVGLVGHSLGGAVVIAAGARSPAVSAVVTLAAQSYGADAVSCLAPRPLLLIHGSEDAVLPSACSIALWNQAGKSAELHIFQGAGHLLDETADEVHTLVRDWLVRHLAGADRASPS